MLLSRYQSTAMSQEFSCLVMVWNMLKKYATLIVMIPSTILLVVFFHDLFWVEGNIRDIYYGATDPSMPLSTSNDNPKKLRRSETIWIWECQNIAESKLYAGPCYLRFTKFTNSTHIILHMIFNWSHSWLCSSSKIDNPNQIIAIVIESLNPYISLTFFSGMWNITDLFGIIVSIDLNCFSK